MLYPQHGFRYCASALSHRRRSKNRLLLACKVVIWTRDHQQCSFSFLAEVTAKSAARDVSSKLTSAPSWT